VVAVASAYVATAMVSDSTRRCEAGADLILEPIERAVHFLVNSFAHRPTKKDDEMLAWLMMSS